jgi:hypothetical protein
MNRWLTPSGIVALSLLLIGTLPSAFADTPTTKPTTQPAKTAAKQPIPKDWVKVENKKYGYVFYVPKKWKQDVVNDTQADYFLPAAKNKKPPLFLLVGGECHQTTVEAEADEERKDMTGGAKALKITKDEAVTLDDQPAWMFTAQGTSPETLPPTKPGQQPRVIKHKTQIYKVISVQGKVIYSISFEADDDAFSDNLSTAKKVIDSFSWVPVPVPVKP